MKDIKSNKKFKNISLIYAPLDGETLSLEKIDDPMIAVKALGEGVAINPTSDLVLSPCNGSVKLIHSNNHVIIIQSNEGAEILIHIGLNTKDLPSSLFTRLVQEGSVVSIGEELIKFDKEALLKQAKSLNAVIVVNNLDPLLNDFKVIKASGNVVAGKSLIYAVGDKETIASKEFNDYLVQITSKKENLSNTSKEITLLNKTGLHARPAAFLVNLAKKFPAEITLQKGNESANAKSLIEILGLGVNYQEKLIITTKGEEAKTALDQLIAAFSSSLGEKVDAMSTKEDKSSNIVNSKVANANAVTNFNQKLADKIKQNTITVTIEGVSIYPGLVTGKAFLIENEEINIKENSSLNQEEEQNRLNQATEVVKSKLQQFIKEAKEHNKLSQAEIFSAHLEVLSDEFLLKGVKEELNNGKTAEYAFKQATSKTCNVLNQTQNSLLQERMADIKDIEQNILRVLAGKNITTFQIPEDSIVIAKDLTPSSITSFNSNVKGVVLAKGSATAHISIMMKNEGIPSLVAAGEEILAIKDGTAIILRSKEGKLIINPSTNEQLEVVKQIEKLNSAKSANLAEAKKAAVTTDGVKIKVLGNVGAVEQAIKAFDKGGEGIGLVRSEFLFMNTTKAPSEEEQYKIYQAICDAMHGEEVVVRTLDVGGDKPISYINLPLEENPIMGLRGVRNYPLNKEIFYSQIRALLRVNPSGVCKIMLPMVSEISEVTKVKEVILKEKKDLGIKTKVEVGIMVEVPSVALLSKQFARHVDFFSLGTNDLAQYILAMDRGHSILTKHLNNLNPALLKSIAFTCQGAKEYNIPVGVCGAMASELESVPLLVGLGVSSLSCSSELIPDVKALIRNISFEKCKTVAEKALELESEEEVKTLIYSEFDGYL